MSVAVGETSRHEVNGIQNFQRVWPIQLLVLLLVLVVLLVVPSSALCRQASPSPNQCASTGFRPQAVCR